MRQRRRISKALNSHLLQALVQTRSNIIILYVLSAQMKKRGKARERSANWWVWLLWQNQTLLRGTQWKHKRPSTKAASREILIRYKKKSHSENDQTSEQVVQSSCAISLEIFQIRMDNWSNLNWPQSWFCFQQIRLIYSIILWLEKLLSLEYLILITGKHLVQPNH